MGKLNFYTADAEYVLYLQKAEQDKRGFSRVPNTVYSEKCKQTSREQLWWLMVTVHDVMSQMETIQAINNSKNQ